MFFISLRTPHRCVITGTDGSLCGRTPSGVSLLAAAGATGFTWPRLSGSLCPDESCLSSAETKEPAAEQSWNISAGPCFTQIWTNNKHVAPHPASVPLRRSTLQAAACSVQPSCRRTETRPGHFGLALSTSPSRDSKSAQMTVDAEDTQCSQIDQGHWK